jgi:hypothetical protein
MRILFLLFFPMCCFANTILPVQVYLDQPYLNKTQLTRWATHTTQALFTFSHKNYRQKLLFNKSYFTETSFKEYLRLLSKTKMLDMVVENKLAINPHFKTKPHLLKEGPKNLRYSWTLKESLTLFYENPSQVFQQPLKITLTIQRVKPAISTEGIAITNIYLHG